MTTEQLERENRAVRVEAEPAASGQGSLATPPRSGTVRVEIEELVVPTYPMRRRSALPPLFDEESTYPFVGFLTNAPGPVKRTFQAVVITNDFLRVTVLPELGGRVWQIEDIHTGGNYLHANDVFRAVRIPPCWAFLSSGIELNFPTTHSPTGMDPVGYELVEKPHGGAGVAVGEREMRWGLSWRAEILLYPGSRALCISVRAWNPTSVPRSVQWWSNTTQPAGGDTEFVFPEEPVLAHVIGEENGNWPMVAGCDRRWHRHYDSMCGLFWEPTRTDYFGIYHHEREWGLLHLADPAQLPGKKLWTFGNTGFTENWTLAMTRGGGRSCEIQSGIPTTQKEFIRLEPGGELAFSEFWMPVDERGELDEPRRPLFRDVLAQVGGPEAVAVSRTEIVSPSGSFWKQLLAAQERQDLSWLGQNARYLEDTWPPTGLDLGEALDWAARTVGGIWDYPRALWLCAHERWEEARFQLETVVQNLPAFAQAEAVLGLLLWKEFGQPVQGWEHLKSALENLPDGQLYVHANTLLRELGRLEERRLLVAQWPPGDFRQAEAQAEIALDSEDYHEALRILRSVKWERQHARHRRGTIWLAACVKLGRPEESAPAFLGEDPVQVDE